MTINNYYDEKATNLLVAEKRLRQNSHPVTNSNVTNLRILELEKEDEMDLQ